MNKQQTLGIIRHALTFVGGLLVMNGVTSEAISTEVIGAAMTFIGGIWSIIDKKK